MELQNFITNTENYQQEFKKYNLNVKKHSKRKLLLVKYYKDKEYDFVENPWLRYCRGAVINTETNKVVCLPPPKAYPVNDIATVMEVDTPTKEYQLLIDGTMVNLFYHNNEWVFSTRSSIGANNSWDGKVSFRKMFEEAVSSDKWMDNLQKDYSYSFVLVHKNNRIVSPVVENNVYLVENYKIGETIERVPLDTIEGIENVMTFTLEKLSSYMDPNLQFSVKGFTVKNETSKRLRWLNPMYEYVSNLKMNYNDKLLNYIGLRRNGTLREYLNYFPEDSYEFSRYRDSFQNIKMDLLKHYSDHFIHKTLDKKDIPYEFKPLLYELHGDYFRTGDSRNERIVGDYLHSLPEKKFMFVYNYYKERVL